MRSWTRSACYNKHFVKSWLALAALLSITACGKKAENQPEAPGKDVIARVNGREITREKFEKFVRFRQGELEQVSVAVPQKELFREFLGEELLLEEAEDRGIQASESEVQQYLQDWLLTDQNPSPDLIEYVRDFLKGQKFIREAVTSQVNVSLEELQQYYQQHEEEFIMDDSARVLEILVTDPELAGEIRKKLRDRDKATFKALARRHSQGAGASKEGELGAFQRGELPEEFEKVIFSLKKGQVSAVFQSTHGFHIFMMDEWIARHTQKFNEVQERIFEELTADKERTALDEYMNQILKNASIEIYDRSLNSEFSAKEVKQ